MNIDFNKTETQKLERFKGGEGVFEAKMYADKSIRLLHGRLKPGSSIGMHTHETNSEVIFVLSGTGYTVCDGVKERVAPGMCLYCPKGSSHTLVNDSDEDLVFYAAVPEL
jgi:mannose-6-phosphate isomerase-like protein (cupin superfamily)